MKKITLHRAATDNVGGFQDAGSVLTIGTDQEAGVITAERAADLVDTGGAVDGTSPDAPDRNEDGRKGGAAAKKAG